MTTTMTTSVDVLYFEWLISQIDIRKNKTYFYVFERMHNLEFVWTVPNDDNRIQDALDVRREFMDQINGHLNLASATLLEILISLSRRAEFITSESAHLWAWRLLKNLKLTNLSDPVTNSEAQKIDDILEALVWRTYSSSGEGGFFPLKYPKEDQTKVEIWYQLNAYVIERQR